MSDFIPLMKPNIKESNIDDLVSVLRSGMLVQGKMVESFENDISSYIGTPHCSCLSNGTATLHTALLALGIGAGDEVIVPAFSYIATANAVELVGARPIFVDIDIDTFNIRTNELDKYLSPKTKAIIPVHEFGLAANISVLSSWAKKNNLFVIEDAACALGAKENGRHVGTFGEFGSFSFHPRKAITSGEGGMLITSDPKLDIVVKALRNHGVVVEDGQQVFKYAGLNYRMTDFQAALLIGQLKELDDNILKREKLATIYLKEIKSSQIKLPVIPEGKKHAWQTFHIVLDQKVNRSELIETLKSHGIGSNYGAQCMPYMEYYQKKYKLDCHKLFPNAMRAYESGLALPLYELLKEENVVYISSVLNKVVS